MRGLSICLAYIFIRESDLNSVDAASFLSRIAEVELRAPTCEKQVLGMEEIGMLDSFFKRDC